MNKRNINSTIISKQLDIKLRPFTQEELDSVLRKNKNEKAAGLDEIPPEVWKNREFDDIQFRHYVVFCSSTRPKMPFKVMHRKEETHSNGSYERKSRRWARLIIWDKVKVSLRSDAWQLFPLDDDQTCHSKDWVGVELLYNSIKTEVRQLE